MKKSPILAAWMLSALLAYAGGRGACFLAKMALSFQVGFCAWRFMTPAPPSRFSDTGFAT
jgi:hypothetical protein